MFKIVDGREYFYQWDLDRQVAVEDATITEVHFCNRTDECSLVVEVVDGVANVPNIILQKNFNVRVFGYDGKATRYDKVFEVKARSKPSDYVYTEVEIKNYDDLAARIDEIEEKGFSEEVINKAVSDYMEKNPVDLDGYATEDYVDEAVKNVEVDLTGYATEEYVDKAIENIDIPEPEKVDLTGYAKEQWVKDQGYLTEHQDLSSYAKRTDIPTKVSQLSNDKGYLTQHQDISHLATIGQVQTIEGKIPTKTSQLTNDSGFLTEHQDISGKADRDHTHPSYALKTEIPDVSGKADKVHSHPEYLVEQDLSEYAKKSDIPEGQDLSKYALKTDIPDVSDFISEIPSEYITESELNTKNYATEKYVDDAIAGIETSGSAEVYNLVLPTGYTAFTDSKSIEYLTRAWNGESVVALCEGRILTSVTVDADDNEIRARAFFTDNLALHTYYAYTFRRDGENVWKLALKTSGAKRIPDTTSDLSNYYTKEETAQAIQDALNAIGVAEGGAY